MLALHYRVAKIRSKCIDDDISAEIPNQLEDMELHELVLKNMIHGPCGLLNINSPCMNDKMCSKNSPRQLIPETQSGEDGYPLYRRRKPMREVSQAL